MADNGISYRIDDAELKRLITDMPRNIGKFLDGEAEHIVNDMKQQIRETSPGRVYQRPGGKTHVASRPGDAPNIDEGTLINSLGWKPKGADTRVITVSAEHGYWLEFGTQNEDGSTRMAPRPYMGPAFERERAVIGKHAQEFNLTR